MFNTEISILLNTEKISNTEVQYYRKKNSIFLPTLLHMNKGKEYFKKFGIHKATIYRWMKKIEENGNCDRKPGSGLDEFMWQIKMGYKAL